MIGYSPCRRWQAGILQGLTSSSATLNGRTEATGDQLPVESPRNPRSEADRGWLQRLVRPYCIALRADISESWNLLSEAVSGEPERLQQ